MHASNAYGDAVHKAIEAYLKFNTPLPEEFKKFQKWVDVAASLPGERLIEAKMGLTKEGKICGFFDKDVWWRGLPDFVAVNEAKGIARIIDWKAGKSSKYADTDQLELLALAVFAKYPKVNKVKGLLAFLVVDQPIDRTYYRKDFAVTLSKWIGRIDAIRAAEEHDVWNPTASGLCNPWCPVKPEHCEFKE